MLKTKALLPATTLLLPLEDVVAFALADVCVPEPVFVAPEEAPEPVFVAPEEAPDEAFDIDSEDFVLAVVVADTEAILLSPAVIVTGNWLRSVALYVVVLDPGKLASEPAALSAHTAPPAESSVHSWLKVNSSESVRLAPNVEPASITVIGGS
jgi:hypothetical protein